MKTFRGSSLSLCKTGVAKSMEPSTPSEAHSRTAGREKLFIAFFIPLDPIRGQQSLGQLLQPQR